MSPILWLKAKEWNQLTWWRESRGMQGIYCILYSSHFNWRCLAEQHHYRYLHTSVCKTTFSCLGPVAVFSPAGSFHEKWYNGFDERRPSSGLKIAQKLCHSFLEQQNSIMILYRSMWALLNFATFMIFTSIFRQLLGVNPGEHIFVLCK